MSRPLRICLVSQQDLGGPPHPVPAYRFWRRYFAAALSEVGHELLEAPGCDWAASLLPLPSSELAEWREATWSRALNWLRAEHNRRPIDLFLSYLYPGQIHPGSLADIRRLGIPRVNLFCDNVREFRRIPREFAHFDLHWVPEFKALPLYRRAGLPFIHAPMPCWIAPSLRSPLVLEHRPASFIGTRDHTRAALFAEAFSIGLKATVFGPGWKDPAPAMLPSPALPGTFIANQLAFVRQHGVSALLRKVASRLSPEPPIQFDFAPFAGPLLSDDDYWSVTRGAAVCLGVNRYPSPRHPLSKPDTYSRLRDIEAPMAGACYLTEWTEGIEQLYEPGTEIETYRDASELVEKTRALASDPARCARLRAAGQRRALAEHTIPCTLDRLGRQLGIL